MAECAYCATPVDPSSRHTYHGVRGWERKALRESRKSGSDIVLREPDGRFACSDCVTALRAGVSPAQGSLI